MKKLYKLITFVVMITIVTASFGVTAFAATSGASISIRVTVGLSSFFLNILYI